MYNSFAMPKSKLTVHETEQQLPQIARAATRSAYRRALKAGSVVVYRNGELRRVAAGGSNTFVKKLEPRTRIAKGSKFEIKPVEA